MQDALRVEQVLAAYLGKLYQTFSIDTTKDKVVITVPNHADEATRNKLIVASKIAGLPRPKILEEGAALALSYSHTWRRDLEHLMTPKMVAFVDAGHSKTSITVADFLGNDVSIIA